LRHHLFPLFIRARTTMADLTPPPLARSRTRLVALGIEGSANKVGVGIVAYQPSSHSPSPYTILSNPRKTYISRRGTASSRARRRGTTSAT
jgi:hypothetical protein